MFDMTLLVLTLPQDLHTQELNFLPRARPLHITKWETRAPTYEFEEYRGNTLALHRCMCSYIHICHALLRQLHKDLRTRFSQALMHGQVKLRRQMCDTSTRFKVKVSWEKRPESGDGQICFSSSPGCCWRRQHCWDPGGSGTHRPARKKDLFSSGRILLSSSGGSDGC